MSTFERDVVGSPEEDRPELSRYYDADGRLVYQEPASPEAWIVSDVMMEAKDWEPPGERVEIDWVAASTFLEDV